MPFSDARDLLESMAEIPPLHVCMAVLAGVKPKERAEEMSPEDLKAMRAWAEAVNG